MTEIFENIRKIYTFTKPCGELADHIEFFSESSLEETARYLTGETFSVRMFASYTPTFYINLGAPYQIAVSGKRHFIGADDDILIVRNSVVERYNSPNDHIFTVKFHPGSVEALLGVKQAALIDRVVNLHQILPSSLLRQIKQPITFTERVGLMENFLLTRLKTKSDYYLKFVTDTIATYVDGDMQFNNDALAEKMFTTSKTINRYFNQVVGTSPKSFFSIMRARTALTGYVSNKQLFVPFDYGYYDMSHFYKDVVKLTGEKVTANR